MLLALASGENVHWPPSSFHHRNHLDITNTLGAPYVVDLVRVVNAPNVLEDSSVRSHFAQVQVSASRLLFLQSDKMDKTMTKHKLDA